MLIILYMMVIYKEVHINIMTFTDSFQILEVPSGAGL